MRRPSSRRVGTGAAARLVALTLGATLALSLVAVALAAAPQTTHLAAYFPGDGSPTEVIGQQTGTLEGNATFGPGELGQAFSLDGTGDAVEFAGGDWQLPEGDFSVVAWVKTSDATTSQIVIEEYECAGACANNDSSSMWRLGIDKGAAVGIVREDGTAADATEIKGAAVADGQWHHIAFVRDTILGKANVYVDGSLSTSAPLTSDMNGPLLNADGDADPVVIGAHIVGGTSNLEGFFNGQIDEVGFYNVALTADEMAAIAKLAPAGLGLNSQEAPSAAPASAPPATTAASSATSTAAPTAGPTSSQPATPGSPDQGSGSSTLIVVIAGLLILALVILALVWRSRNRSSLRSG